MPGRCGCKVVLEGKAARLFWKAWLRALAERLGWKAWLEGVAERRGCEACLEGVAARRGWKVWLEVVAESLQKFWIWFWDPAVARWDLGFSAGIWIPAGI